MTEDDIKAFQAHNDLTTPQEQVPREARGFMKVMIAPTNQYVTASAEFLRCRHRVEIFNRGK